VAAGVFIRALTPVPLQWHRSCANGSSVRMEGADAARFTIVRRSVGPRQDPQTHGYAYLTSRGIPLPKGWRHIRVEGEWWMEADGINGYPEVIVSLHSRYPSLPHGKRLGNVRVCNYLEAAYDTWKGILRFRECGRNGVVESAVRRRIPVQPIPFRMDLIRDAPGGTVRWEFSEKENGRWTVLHRQRSSSFFPEGFSGEIFWKTGAWSSLDRPVESRIHFRRLNYRLTMERKGPTTEKIWHRPPKIFPEKKSDTAVSQELPGGKNCLELIPKMAGLQSVGNYREGLEAIVADLKHRSWTEDGAHVAVYASGKTVRQIVSFYRHHSPPPGWRKSLDMLSERKGGIVVWERNGYSLQVLITRENGRNIVVMGCGRKIRP